MRFILLVLYLVMQHCKFATDTFAYASGGKMFKYINLCDECPCMYIVQ